MIPSVFRPAPSSCGPMSRGYIAAAKGGTAIPHGLAYGEGQGKMRIARTLPSLVARFAILNNVPVAPKQAVKRPGRIREWGRKVVSSCVSRVSAGRDALTERNQGFPGNRHFRSSSSDVVWMNGSAAASREPRYETLVSFESGACCCQMSRLIGRGALLHAGSAILLTQRKGQVRSRLFNLQHFRHGLLFANDVMAADLETSRTSQRESQKNEHRTFENPRSHSAVYIPGAD